MKRRVALLLLMFAMMCLLAVPVFADQQMQDGWDKASKRYYQNGDLYTGQKKIDGKWYLFQNGKMKKGFQKVLYKGETITVYYDKKTGAKQFGSKKIKGNWYYFQKKSGKMQTGWRKVSGKKKYYYDKDGKRWSEQHLILKNTMYEFTGDGELWRTISKKKSKKSAGKSKRGTKTYELLSLSEDEIIEKIGPLFTQDQKKTGVLACVSMAQFMLESWNGRSELALMSNNCFGIQAFVSGNNWRSASAWDGVSTYRRTKVKVDSNGKKYIRSALFRKYKCIEDSIADHSAYLIGAMNGSRLRYAGLKGCTDYKKAVNIIANGGYAEDDGYAAMLKRTIRKYKLTRFNA